MNTTYVEIRTIRAAADLAIVSSRCKEHHWVPEAHLVVMEFSRIDDRYVAICQRLSSRLEPVINLM